MLDFLKNLLSSNSIPTKPPNITFGRYTDMYKDKSKYKEWDNAVECFFKENHFQAFVHLINYLNEDARNNARITQHTNDKIHFEIAHGSKQISGHMNKDVLHAEARLATGKISLGAMRTLLEENYELKHTRYALEGDDVLTLVFQSDIQDASPYKIYNGLKELALRADHQDDILLYHFSELKIINYSTITPLREEEKAIKYEYFNQRRSRLIDDLQNLRLDPDQYPGAISYLILAFAFKVDYLVKPEGRLLEHLEHIHTIYYHKSNLSAQQKNKEMIDEVRRMEKIDAPSLYNELYQTVHTFGITQASSLNKFIEFANTEMQSIDWYINNGHPEIAQALCDFIVGHITYNHAMPEPIQRCLHLYYEVTESVFFTSLGFAPFTNKMGLPQKSKLEEQLKMLKNDFADSFDYDEADWKSVKADSILSFSLTWLRFIMQCKITG